MGHIVTRGVGKRVPVIFEGDPLYDDVISLVKFNESNGSTSITDLKGSSWTFTSGAQVSSSNQLYGNNLDCNYDGSSSFTSVDCAYAGLGSHDFSSTNLVIEFAFYIVSDEAQNPLFHFGERSSDYLQASIASGLGSMSLQATGGFSTATITHTFSTGTWYHFALTKTGAGAWVVYLDGNEIGSGTGLTWNGNETIHLGYNRGGSPVHQSSNFKYDELRITNSSTMRYPAEFSPPTATHPEF